MFCGRGGGRTANSAVSPAATGEARRHPAVHTEEFAVLSDRDRRALQGIETDLARSDPAFAARMRGKRRTASVIVLCALLYIATPLVALLFGWTGVLMAAAVVAAAISALFLPRRS